MQDQTVKIFVDFDGTITTQDVGDAMFETFGGQASVSAVDEYRRELISAADCFRRECEACGEVEIDMLDTFLDSRQIDVTFSDFVEYSRRHGFEVYIVSDGMDYYIHRILERHGVESVPSFSNALHFVPVDGTSRVRFKPSFPYQDEVCDRCACCKRNHMLTLSGDTDIIVYVGEGYSDRCPARYADVVFAKDELLKYCEKENISFYPYHTFGDVTQRLELLRTNRGGSGGGQGFRKRQRAELARRAVYMGG